MDEMLKKIYPNSTAQDRAKFIRPLQLAMMRYNINNVNRIRAFLAQIGHESGQLSAVYENLNYSLSSLRSVFGKYFPTNEMAAQYARQPEKIANRVYANRLGNGDEQCGDGWKYRGRGLIQITGKSNYEAATNGMYALPMGICFVTEPNLLSTPEYAAQSAAWWWENAGLNALADKLGGSDDADIFRQISKRINGGYNGLEDRIAIYSRTQKYIKYII